EFRRVLFRSGYAHPKRLNNCEVQMSIRTQGRDTTEHLRFLHTVASLYHLEGKTQAEIAGMLNVSRSRVLRALHEARAVGIVQISVVDPSRTDESLAADLERDLDLGRAVVVAGH